MGKRAGLSIGKKNCLPTKNNIFSQASKILETVSSSYGINPSLSWHCVGDSLSEKKDGRTKYVKL
jgi:hypothetical protein